MDFEISRECGGKKRLKSNFWGASGLQLRIARVLGMYMVLRRDDGADPDTIISL